MPTDQEKLIGIHKSEGDNIFTVWLNHEDMPTSHVKKHRQLIENVGNRGKIIEMLSTWIIEHHISEKKISRLKRRKEILDKHGYLQYLDKQSLLPKSDTTQKGNATEILMAEYLKFSSELDLLVFRLRYNPNVDQSMKGDDVLLFNKKNLHHQIIVGESKFRSTPDKQSVLNIVNSFKAGDNIPISIPFVASIIEDNGDESLADNLESLNSELHKLKTNIINVGLLMSNENTSATVERHINSDNDQFVMISLSIENPADIITNSFTAAIEKLKGL